MKTTSEIELESKNFSLEEKAKIICIYNGKKGTKLQIEKVLKSYSTHEYLDNFIVPRWHVIRATLG